MIFAGAAGGAGAIAFGARRRGIAPVAVSLLVLPLALTAQAPRWEVDLSASRIEYDTLAPLGAPSLSALGEWQRPSVFGRLSGSLTGFEGAGWSGQVRGDLAGWIAPAGRGSPLRVEFAGAAGGARHSNGFNSAIGRADARLHLRARSSGGWVGASLASARNSFDSASVGGAIPSVGLWTQTALLRATVSVLATRADGNTYPEANVALSMTRGAVDLTAYGGLRRIPRSRGGSAERWAGATASVWFDPRAAVVVSGGTYASDVLQGLPGGRFVSIGVRLTRRRARPIPVSAQAPIVYTPEAASSGSIGFVVEDAERVEIAGDWTGWERVPLTRDDSGRWIVPATLAPGVYRFNLRVDGERWIVPDSVAEIDDGYGGRVGLLIISN